MKQRFHIWQADVSVKLLAANQNYQKETVMKKIFIVLCLIMFISSCSVFSDQLLFETETFRLGMNKKGQITKLEDIRDNKNYLSGDSLAYLLSLRIDNRITYPRAVEFNKEEEILTLSFAGNIQPPDAGSPPPRPRPYHRLDVRRCR